MPTCHCAGLEISGLLGNRWCGSGGHIGRLYEKDGGVFVGADFISARTAPMVLGGPTPYVEAEKPPLGDKGRWEVEDLTEGIRTCGNWQPTIPQSICG